jgi:hypothetical protein
MLILDPYEVCPYGDSCGHRNDFFELGVTACEGVNPDRNNGFTCDFFREVHRAPQNGDNLSHHNQIDQYNPFDPDF